MTTRKRSGISADRAYRIQSNMSAKLHELYATAKAFHWTNEKIIEVVAFQVFNSPELKRAPYYVRGYLRGVHETMRHQLYHSDLVWVMWVNGELNVSQETSAKPLMTSKQITALTEKEIMHNGFRQTPLDYKSPWQRIDGDKSRHVWKDCDGNPMPDKPFDRKWENK